MPYLLLLLLLIAPVQAATITDGILASTDTTGTNATARRVTISAQTNLLAGTLTSSNNLTVGAKGTIAGTLSVTGQITNLALQASSIVIVGANNELGSLVDDDPVGAVLKSGGIGVAPSWSSVTIDGGTGTNLNAGVLNATNDIRLNGVSIIGVGDTIWTNDNGTIKIIQPIVGETDSSSLLIVDGSVTHTAGTLIDFKNNGSSVLTLSPTGQATILGSSPEFFGFNGSGYFQLDVDYLELNDGAKALLLFQPTASSSSVVISVDSSATHISGNIGEIKNNGTNVFSSTFDGRIVLAGTTNHIVFGATNDAPSSVVAPTKWISVQVSGESAVYRIPLYE